MAQTRLLYFSPTGVALYRWRAGVLSEDARFEQSDAGLARFSTHVGTLKSSVIHVLVDVVEEGFHIDTIPFVRGADRKALIQRRLAQRFRDVTLATSISLGYEKTQRREERVLLTSCTNPGEIQPWLRVLEQAEVPVSGVYSPALLANALATTLKLAKPRMLVVGVHECGVRQSYVHSGCVRFSRLNPFAGEDVITQQTVMAALERETERLYQYLRVTHELGDDSRTVNAIVIAPPGQTERVQGFSIGTPAQLRIEVIDQSIAAKRVGLKGAPAHLGVEALYLHLLARKRPAQQYASRNTQARYGTRNLQLGLVASGALVGLACLFAAGIQLLQGFDLSNKIEADETRRLAADSTYNAITTTFPTLPTTLENLRTALQQYDALNNVNADPAQFANRISRVLGRFPQMELERLTWRMETAVQDSTAGSARTVPYEAVDITATVTGIGATDYRTLGNTIEAFAEELKTAQGFEVLAADLPFDIGTEKTVSSEAAGKASDGAARFSITIANKAL